MTDARVLSLIAGLFFGLWPLVMNRSGLPANISTVVFAGTNLLIAVALTIYGGAKLQGSVGIGIAAGIVGAVGLTAFNLMLSKSKPTEVGSLFVLMVMVQIAVPAVYQMAMSGEVSLKKVAGFLAAFAATVLLG